MSVQKGCLKLESHCRHSIGTTRQSSYCSYWEQQVN